VGSSGVGSKNSLVLNNKLNNNGTISPRRLDDLQSRDSPALSVQLGTAVEQCPPETMSDQGS
jgi:hypothetical protein